MNDNNKFTETDEEYLMRVSFTYKLWKYFMEFFSFFIAGAVVIGLCINFVCGIQHIFSCIDGHLLVYILLGSGLIIGFIRLIDFHEECKARIKARRDCTDETDKT